MKKAALIILLLSFAVKPMYQLGYLAYFELNIDYIIATYCVNKEKPAMQCNGKCHLMNQLAVGNAENNDAKTVKLIEAFYPVFFQEYAYVSSSSIAIKNSQSLKWPSTKNLDSRYLHVPVPPPKV